MIPRRIGTTLRWSEVPSDIVIADGLDKSLGGTRITFSMIDPCDGSDYCWMLIQGSRLGVYVPIQESLLDDIDFDLWPYIREWVRRRGRGGNIRPPCHASGS